MPPKRRRTRRREPTHEHQELASRRLGASTHPPSRRFVRIQRHAVLTRGRRSAGKCTELAAAQRRLTGDRVLSAHPLQEWVARRRGEDVGEHDRRDHDHDECHDDGEASEVGAESDDEAFHISCSERRWSVGSGERIRHGATLTRASGADVPGAAAGE